MPVRVEETANLFRCKVVNSEGIRYRPRVVGLLQGHSRRVVIQAHSVQFYFISNENNELKFEMIGQLQSVSYLIGCD